MGFLTDLEVYNYHCIMSLIQNFVSESETNLPDPFKGQDIEIVTTYKYVGTNIDNELV